MKKKKKISIKKGHMNQVRNNFREVIVVAVDNQVEKLTSQIQSIRIDGKGNYRVLDDGKKKIVNELRLARSKLNRKLRESICKCLQCGRIEGDMKYNPASNEWHCPDCWKATELEYKRTKALADSGKPTGDYAFDYYSTFVD